MRTGHCLTKEHLYKIKLKDNPLCECGRIENMDHIFFECPINAIPNLDLYREFIKLKILTPISIHSVLSNLKEDSIRLIMIFLNINQIKL